MDPCREEAAPPPNENPHPTLPGVPVDALLCITETQGVKAITQIPARADHV